ncbi:MAG: FtsX-like permease family protein [Desulfobacteraceae bacterium]|nr:FtsX-like permease family protein [Desulfobacteraceae bacterium]
MPFESFVIKRYLKIKHHKKLVPVITILATLGVAVGVMVLMVVIAVMTGFQFELKKRILGVEAHMAVMRYGDWISDYGKLIKTIEKKDGVLSASPYVVTQGMLQSAKGVLGIQLRGIDPDNHSVQIPIVEGKLLSQLTDINQEQGQCEAQIIIGKVLAEKLKVAIGDGLILMAANSRDPGLRKLPKMYRLKVVGLFDTGMNQYDNNLVFTNMFQLQRLAGISDMAAGLEIRLSDPDNVELMTDEIGSELGMNYWVTHWKKMHRNLFAMLLMQKVVMFVIMTLIIVVAAFNIASALIMMVREKNKEIAILKAIGATHRSIHRIFLTKGIAIGSCGISIGIFTGLALCWILARYKFIDLPGDVYFLTTLPVQLNIIDIAVIVSGTMAICILASLYPAVRAAKMNPADAFRMG